MTARRASRTKRPGSEFPAKVQWRPEEGFEPLIVDSVTDEVREAVEKRWGALGATVPIHEIAITACEAMVRAIQDEATSAAFAVEHLVRHYEARPARLRYARALQSLQAQLRRGVA